MVDEKDLEILDVMRQDGRATYADIGKVVGLAASSVHERVRKLEGRGVIMGYGPRIDPTKIGRSMLAYISVVSSESCRDISDRVEGWPEIEEFHSVAGEDCAMLKVRTADTEELEDLLERLRAIPGVGRTRTTIVLRTRWEHEARAIRG
jgi:Lrp/AsnC family leucine-responsive transcriptional regulator